MLLSEQIEAYHLLKEKFGTEYEVRQERMEKWQEHETTMLPGREPLLIIIDAGDSFKKIPELVNRLRLSGYMGMLLLLSKTKKRSKQAEEKIRAVDAGADEYLDGFQTKEEVFASIKALLRRVNWRGDCALTVSGREFRINPQNWKLEIDGKGISLTKIEFSIIHYLLLHLNQTVSYKELYEAVWKKEYLKDDANIMAHVHRIRKKMEDDPQNPRYVQNVYGIGYRMEGEGWAGE